MGDSKISDQALLAAAAERPAAERAAFFDRVCADDPDRRARLDRLLEARVDGPAAPGTGGVRTSAGQEPLGRGAAAEFGTVIARGQDLELVGEGTAASRNWQERLADRVAIEVLAALVCLARLPIIGAYLFIILAALAAASDAPADNLTRHLVAALKSETGGRIFRWFLPAHSYFGASGLTAFGEAAAKLLFGLYLLSLPVRLLWPLRTPPSFGRKFRRLVVFLLSVIVVIAWLLRSAKFAPGTGYWEMVGVFAALLAMFSVPLLPLLALECWIERKMLQLQSPDVR